MIYEELTMKDIYNAIIEEEPNMTYFMTYKGLNPTLSDPFSSCNKIYANFDLYKNYCSFIRIKKLIKRKGIVYEINHNDQDNRKTSSFTVTSKHDFYLLKSIIRKTYDFYISKVDQSTSSLNDRFKEITELYKTIEGHKYEDLLTVYSDYSDTFIALKYDDQLYNVDLGTNEMSLSGFYICNDNDRLFIPIEDAIQYLKEEKLKKLIT